MKPTAKTGHEVVSALSDDNVSSSSPSPAASTRNGCVKNSSASSRLVLGETVQATTEASMAGVDINADGIN